MNSYVFYHILLLFEDVFMKDVTLEGARVPEAYTSYERSEVRKVFKAFDEDGSGSLDTEEIEQVMCSFGITPFKSTVEALPEVYATFPQETAPRNCFILTNCTGVVVVYGRRMRKEQISTTKSQEQKINFSDVIQESAIAVVDEDSTGVVEFHEFVHLLTIYMKTEGFTRHLAHKRAGISKRFSEKSHSYAWGRNFSTKQQLLKMLFDFPWTLT